MDPAESTDVAESSYEASQNTEISRLDSLIANVTRVSWGLVWFGLVVAAAGPIANLFSSGLQLNLYGDYVGGTVASIWGLSGVLFIYSAFLGQKQQILFQKIELRYTRAEMNATREELSGQKKAMEKLNAINTKQLFESSFFQMLTIFHGIVGSIDIRKTDDKSSVTSVGRDCFQVFVAELTSTIEKQLGPKTRESLDLTYREFYSSHENDLGHYFRYLYHLVKFVHFAKVKNKRVYFGIITAQLSAYELALMVYNCISNQGYGRFRLLADRYELFRDLNLGHLHERSDLGFLNLTSARAASPDEGAEDRRTINNK